MLLTLCITLGVACVLLWVVARMALNDAARAENALCEAMDTWRAMKNERDNAVINNHRAMEMVGPLRKARVRLDDLKRSIKDALEREELDAKEGDDAQA